jgi:crotonobetainyl-CoA:carnitine CoA-transferase CaiB-like acyl-CoA transferase
MGFAPLSRFWRARDGWVRTHANYPWHRSALLDALGVGDDVDALEAAIAERSSTDIESAVFAAGGVAAAVRPLDEWLAHPQGAAVHAEPLVSHHDVAGATPRTDGMRVLDLTRVIAGPVCTRFLASVGADVVRLDPPDHLDMQPGTVADTLLGKRSAFADLSTDEGARRLRDLLPEADVVVCGYRPGGLDRFGLSDAELAAQHPGLVIVRLDAWGHTGPWAERRGFDSVVQAPTGIAFGEGTSEQPGALPCQLLDHGTGYLAAAAALDGLRRQRAQGGTHVRRLSLARTAAWLTSRGTRELGSAEENADDDPAPWLQHLSTPDGAMAAVRPPGTLDGRSREWSSPPARYGQDAPAWTAH